MSFGVLFKISLFEFTLYFESTMFVEGKCSPIKNMRCQYTQSCAKIMITHLRIENVYIPSPYPLSRPYPAPSHLKVCVMAYIHPQTQIQPCR